MKAAISVIQATRAFARQVDENAQTVELAFSPLDVADRERETRFVSAIKLGHVVDAMPTCGQLTGLVTFRASALQE